MGGIGRIGGLDSAASHSAFRGCDSYPYGSKISAFCRCFAVSGGSGLFRRFAPAATEREEHRDLILGNCVLQLRERLLGRGKGSLRIRNRERAHSPCGLHPFGVSNGPLSFIPCSSRTVLALKIINVSVECDFDVAKRSEHHAIKICQCQFGGGLRFLDAP